MPANLDSNIRCLLTTTSSVTSIPLLIPMYILTDVRESSSHLFILIVVRVRMVEYVDARLVCAHAYTRDVYNLTKRKRERERERASGSLAESWCVGANKQVLQVLQSFYFTCAGVTNIAFLIVSAMRKVHRFARSFLALYKSTEASKQFSYL